MKVLQINSVCGYGSTGRIATDIYKILENQGHECLIAYGRGTAPEGINSIKIGTNFDNYMHVAKTRLFDLHGFGSSEATKEFIKKAKEYDPDVIHLHNIHGYYINVELLFNYLKEANKPIVWTLHDCWSFTGHCAYFDYVKCNKWKSGCSSCEQKNEYPSSSILDNSQWNYLKKKELFTSVSKMTIVTPSQWLANLAKESFLGRFDIKTINNGIDLEVFKPTDNGLRKRYNFEDKFVILGVASVWEERKGLVNFLELSKHIDKFSTIVLVGLNDGQIKKLPQNIMGIKRTSSLNELAQIYSVADVYVNPTLEDNFPTTNLESLACGTPVITYNTGGSPESIDERTGIIVEKGNLTELHNAIMEVNKNSKSYYQGNSIQRAQKYFNKIDKYEEYIKLYKIQI